MQEFFVQALPVQATGEDELLSFSTLDGSSLLSQAINAWSDEGVVFCTSGGNNGHSTVPFHVSRTFRNDTVDTLRTVAVRASEIYSIMETGQVLIMWGEEGKDFSAGLKIWEDSAHSWRSPMYSTADGDTVIYDTIHCDDVNVGYRIMITAFLTKSKQRSCSSLKSSAVKR